MHGGLPCDTEVWRSTADRHPLLTGEWWFGDGIYIAEHGILAESDFDWGVGGAFGVRSSIAFAPPYIL